MKKIVLGFVAASLLFVASCASEPHLGGNVVAEAATKQCSDTPRNAISIFFEGIREFSYALLRAVIPEEASVYGVFGNNDSRRGRDAVRQMSANPEVVGEGGSCACSLLSMNDTANPQEKIVVVKRAIVGTDDEVHDYKRSFLVRFELHGNCVLSINSIDQQWERI